MDPLRLSFNLSTGTVTTGTVPRALPTSALVSRACAPAAFGVGLACPVLSELVTRSPRIDIGILPPTPVVCLAFRHRAASIHPAAMPDYDWLVVGTGFAGSALAERLASERWERVLVIALLQHGPRGRAGAGDLQADRGAAAAPGLQPRDTGARRGGTRGVTRRRHPEAPAGPRHLWVRVVRVGDA